MARFEDVKAWSCGDCGAGVRGDLEWCPMCAEDTATRVKEALCGKGTAYISGPMRGLPNDNYDYFDRVQSKLEEEGWEVLNPTRHFGGDHTREWHEYMRLDIADVLKADAIFILPGWQDSKGARLEVQVAKAANLALHYVDSASSTVPAELAAADLVRNGERQAAYGHPGQDFQRTAKIWSGILGVEVSELQVALCMAGLKISRLVGTPEHRDSLEDLLGYAICYERVLEWNKEWGNDQA